MASKHKILEALRCQTLLATAAQYSVAGRSGKTKDEIVAALSPGQPIPIEEALSVLSRDDGMGGRVERAGFAWERRTIRPGA